MCPFQNYFTEYQQNYVLFFLFECFLFFLPVIPNNFYVRIIIILIYFISHRYHVQSFYASTKREIMQESLENNSYKHSCTEYIRQKISSSESSESSQC